MSIEKDLQGRETLILVAQGKIIVNMKWWVRAGSNLQILCIGKAHLFLALVIYLEEKLPFCPCETEY